MAIKELFNDARPQVLFDPRASQRIDPRFKFTRDSVASYYDSQGILRYAPANQPRVGIYEPDENGVMKPAGLLLEEAGTNLVTYSEQFDNAAWSHGSSLTVSANAGAAPDGTTTADLIYANTSGNALTISQNRGASSGTFTNTVFAKASGKSWLILWGAQGNFTAWFNVSTGVVGTVGAGITASIVSLSNGWYRCSVTQTATQRYLFVAPADSDGSTAVTASGTNGILVWGAQLEASPYPTSYIPTAGSTVTRPADLLSVEAPLPSTGSIYIDARSLTSDVDNTLLSAAPASPSTDKLALAIRQPASLYNSKALVYEVDGAFKPTLPFPVPTNARERNLITYGANNYHYRSDSARYTPSSSTSVPANMTRLGIGHDVTDPTKAMTSYINAVYLWPGEIPPTVAEALVRGDVDPKDADAGVFTPAPGSLAFVFNTQGTSTDGNTVVQLPLRGSTNNVLVDWGDNTSSSLIGAAASVTVNHTYPAAGIYPVQIEADSDGTNSGLSRLEFYNNSPAGLVRVLQWGGTTTFQPTTMYRMFRECTQLDFATAARTNLPDTSAVTDWRETFYNCTSLTGAFPLFDTSAATDMTFAWYNCLGVTSYPQFNTANVTNFTRCWEGNTSLTSFPAIDTSAATNLSLAWYGCSNIANFPLINTSNVTNFDSAWYGLSALTSFPAIDTSKGLYFGSATSNRGTWRGCSGLTSFPLLDFSSAISLAGAWYGCTGLTSFPAINTSSVQRFGEGNQGAWQGCTGLTSFPLLDTSSATGMARAWEYCTGLTSFPSINTSNCADFYNTWNNCSSLTSFPALDFSSATGNLGSATANTGTWRNCSSLTSFPFIDTSGINGNIAGAWAGCSGLTSFPLLDLSNATIFGEGSQGAWTSCTGLTSFPAINVSSGTRFWRCWQNCSSMTTFPANFFDSWTGTPTDYCFYQTWDGCSSLTPASVVGILNSIAASGQSAPSGTSTGMKHITIDWDGTGDPATDAAAAITTLKSRNWQIYLNNVLQ